MPNPRPNSIVKLVDPTDIDVQVFALISNARFIYMGEIAQDTSLCMVEGLYCGKRIAHLRPEDFVEVSAGDW